MGKNRKRRNKGKASGMGLEPVPRREKSGRPARADQDRDPMAVVLGARCRRMGWPDGRWDRGRANEPSLGTPAGIALHLGCTGLPEVRRLWKAYTDLDAAEEVYAARILSARRHAKTAKLEMTPERFEVRADDCVDIRTEEERDRAAVNTWARWRGYLGHLQAHEQRAIHDAMLDRSILVDDDNRLTVSGAAFVAAMRVLAAVVERG